ncbi:MAG: HAD family hydrolase [Pseudoruegeria sp.]
MAIIRAVVFDKDGTLFDFRATWSAWARGFLSDLSGGDDVRLEAMADAIGFDLIEANFALNSPVISGTPEDIAKELLPLLPSHSASSLVEHMNQAAAVAPMVEATPLLPLLRGLRESGLRLGIATNDAEAPAKAHLISTDIMEEFDFIAGFDSGFGVKPDPGMLIAFANHVSLAPENILMVGDSRHDLLAGRAAGMQTMAVLTGLSGHDQLAPFADVVVPNIGHLPEWLLAKNLAPLGADFP